MLKVIHWITTIFFAGLAVANLWYFFSEGTWINGAMGLFMAVATYWFLREGLEMRRKNRRRSDSDWPLEAQKRNSEGLTHYKDT